MSLLGDIARTYSDPGLVLRRKRAEDLGEDRLLGYLLIASLISFLSRLPGLISLAPGSESQSLAVLVSAAFVAAMIFGPIFFYMLAALSHLGAGLLGGQGGWKDARLALFWTLFALQPLVIAASFLGDGPWRNTVLLAAAAFFLWTWLRGLAAVEKP